MDIVYSQAHQSPDQSLAVKASWSTVYIISPMPNQTATLDIPHSLRIGKIQLSIWLHTGHRLSEPGVPVTRPTIHLLLSKLGRLQRQRCEIHIILVDIARRSHDVCVSISIPVSISSALCSYLVPVSHFTGHNLTYHGATSGVPGPNFSCEIQNSEPISHSRLAALCCICFVLFP